MEGIDFGVVDNVFGEEEVVVGSCFDGEEDIVFVGVEDNDLVEGIGFVEVVDIGLEVDIVFEEEGIVVCSFVVGVVLCFEFCVSYVYVRYVREKEKEDV